MKCESDKLTMTRGELKRISHLDIEARLDKAFGRTVHDGKFLNPSWEKQSSMIRARRFWR